VDRSASQKSGAVPYEELAFGLIEPIFWFGQRDIAIDGYMWTGMVFR
jgi:hypothetical protein